MRARTLLAVGALGVVAGLAVPSVAGAAAVSDHIAHCYVEIVEEIHHGAELLREANPELTLEEAENRYIEDTRIESCETAPNPLLPEPNEIVWGVISFAVVLFLIMKFGVPLVRQGLQAREDHIRGDLEAAEASKREAEGLLDQYRQQLADARNDAARIIEEARQAADAMRREVQESAEGEATAARERAQSEIEATVARVRGELERSVANFAVTLAERVLQRNLDRDAQMTLVDQYIQEVGGLGSNGGNGSNGGSPGDN